MKRFFSLFGVAILSSVATIAMYQFTTKNNNKEIQNSTSIVQQPSKLQAVNYTPTNAPDFTTAADIALNTVVHVKNVSYRQVNDPIMEFIFGYSAGKQQTQVGTGSGVIISEDGYIVTNNHVINQASEIEITLNNKKAYKAKLIGSDSQMDIALLKIDAEEKLPYSIFGDSDNIKVGEWVLAIGNPYNLNSTVTAGIVSAKARNVGQSSNNIQSFIQTDAAVNPGNSGGALVNTRGELIGINTMISSSTGSYVGYSFAVPSNITRKIIEDLMEYGNVQRGVLGVRGGELNQTISEELGVNRTQGFYVSEITKNSGAEKAGLKKGDIIFRIDNQTINSFAELTGYISTKRPKDVVDVFVIRNSKELKIPVTLTKMEIPSANFFGMQVEELSSSDKKKYDTSYGVKIIESEEYDDMVDKVILSVNGVKITDVQTLSEILNKRMGTGLKIELKNKNKEIERYIIR